jgi:hypothetical protein
LVAAAAAIAVVAASGGVPGRSAARAGDPTPVAARSGAVVRDCGAFVRTVDAGGITAAGWQCFTDAMAGGGSARLRFTQYTTEGDPVVATYTTAGDGAATVLTDSRRDKFAGIGARMQTETCRRPDPRPVARGMFLECTPAAASSPNG